MTYIELMKLCKELLTAARFDTPDVAVEAKRDQALAAIEIELSTQSDAFVL